MLLYESELQQSTRFSVLAHVTERSNNATNTQNKQNKSQNTFHEIFCRTGIGSGG